MERVHSLIYWSRAVRPFSDAELLWLLNAARQTNARLGVTGMLLYKDGCFLQMLEGRLRDLETVFRRIETDPRHHSVQILRTDNGARQFAGWTMGFRNLTDWRLNDPALGVSDLMSAPFNADYFGANPSRAQSMLLCFRGLSNPSTL